MFDWHTLLYDDVVISAEIPKLASPYFLQIDFITNEKKTSFLLGAMKDYWTINTSWKPEFLVFRKKPKKCPSGGL